MTLLPFLATLVAPVASATTMVEGAADLEVLAERADRVIRGEVLATRTERTRFGPTTVATVRVEETLRGAHELVTEVRVPGGDLGNGVHVQVSGAPRLIEGDELVLFLKNRNIVGLDQGALIVGGEHAWRPGRLGAFEAPTALREWLADLPADGDYEAWHMEDIRSLVE